MSDPQAVVTRGPAAATWCARTGGSAATAIRMRLLATSGAQVLAPARTSDGAARAPRADDRELLVGWAEAFAAETGTPPHAQAAADAAIADGRTVLSEHRGEPMAVASHGEPVAGVIRVVFVYTPPEHRRRGLAAATVAAVCTRAFAAGARRAALYADRGDPTATGVYTRLGFEPCGDAAVYALTRQPAARGPRRGERATTRVHMRDLPRRPLSSLTLRVTDTTRNLPGVAAPGRRRERR